jgi:hypothetical protein
MNPWRSILEQIVLRPYRAFSLGASEFVHKPIDLGDYKTAVCGMIQKWAVAKESTDGTDRSAAGDMQEGTCKRDL